MNIHPMPPPTGRLLLVVGDHFQKLHEPEKGVPEMVICFSVRSKTLKAYHFEKVQ